MLKIEIEKLQKLHSIIGRVEELTSALIAAMAGKHILLEGAVGVGKTTIAVAISSHLQKKIIRIDGDERYTEQKLAGWFDPPLVLTKGYSKEAFIHGPLSISMQEGCILLINELNRMPEGTQNIMLSAMDEGRIFVPKFGPIDAKDEFMIIATQNPNEYIGTSQLSEALKDRFISINLSYQTEFEECDIVKLRSLSKDEDINHIAVLFCRQTRKEKEIRRGSSIRGAIDLADIFFVTYGSFNDNLKAWVEAAKIAFLTKIELNDFSHEKFHEILNRIAASVLASYKNTKTSQKQNLKPGSNHTVKVNLNDLQHFEKKKTFDVDGFIHQISTSIEKKNYENIIALLYRIPQAFNDILNEKYFNELIDQISHLDISFLQVKLLAMVMDRADANRRNEIRKQLLQKITFLSRKIAGGAAGIRKTVVTRYRPGLEEIDLDRTLEEQIGPEKFDPENIYCVEKVKQKSSYVLILDVSNSMHLEKIVVGAIATGVFASKLRHDFYGVLTFNRDTMIIKHLSEPNVLETLLNRMLGINSGGATNIRKALMDGWALLSEAQTMHKTGILITDGWATVGGDPIEVASKYDRLHVFGISFGYGGSDPATNAAIAKRGKGKYMYIRHFDDLPFAITKILTNR